MIELHIFIEYSVQNNAEQKFLKFKKKTELFSAQHTNKTFNNKRYQQHDDFVCFFVLEMYL